MTKGIEGRHGEAIKSAIRAQALSLGFDEVGFASPEPDPSSGPDLHAYLSEGRHGEMAWMANTADRRADPRVLWPAVRTVVCLGVNYGPDEDPLASLADPEVGTISVYARGRDYHLVIKKMLKALGRWLADTYSCEVKVFVDTAPVMEKPLAQRAGLGWIGKHTNLVSRRFGSWLFLGEIFTTIELSPDAPETDHCGSCNRCRDACPTAALAEPYRIEPRRCISYLTIEAATPPEPSLSAAFANRIFGCDDCLAACPWNKYASTAAHTALRPREEFARPGLARLAALDDDGFRHLFAGTAVKRIGHARFARNVKLAITNASPPRRAATIE